MRGSSEISSAEHVHGRGGLRRHSVSRRVIPAVDVHTAGEPARVLIASHLQVRGTDMASRMRWCREHLDGLRRTVLHEPRGNPAMCGVLVLPPVRADSDFGIIILEQGDFAPMSGANLISAVTALIETGALDVGDARDEVNLRVDTASGTVAVRAVLSADRVVEVTLENVPSFVAALDQVLDLPGLGGVRVDVVYGGQYYVVASAESLGLRLLPDEAEEIIRVGTLLRLVAQRDIPVRHPQVPAADRINLSMICGPPASDHADGQNAVVLPYGEATVEDSATWGKGVLDRSPCGTGTSGLMAARYARGQLGLHEPFVHESILRTTFTGSLTAEVSVGPLPGVRPTLSGRGWITGFTDLVVDTSDPFPEGFILGG